MRAHAILSASGSHRWLACPPSAQLEEQFPERTSIYAEEGTLAHMLGEVTLNYFLEETSMKEYAVSLSSIKGSDLFSPDMEDYVQMYTDEVIARYAKAKERDPFATMFLERRLDFSRWVPEGFGRGDAFILSEGHIDILDLKYGQNVQVSAKDNPQLRLYALGAYADAFTVLYQPKEVTMTIVQPRNGGVSSETISVEDLLGWGDQIKPIAEQAIKGVGEFKAGEHCRFCRAAATCKALSDYQLEIAKYDFQDPPLMTDEEVADVLARAESFTRWVNKVKDYALQEAENGRKWAGYKLVEGRSSRKIVDVEEAVKILEKHGYTDVYKPQELLPITSLEKLCGKKNVAEMLAGVIVKPQGKPTLVAEDDPREEFGAIHTDFEQINTADDEYIPF